MQLYHRFRSPGYLISQVELCLHREGLLEHFQLGGGLPPHERRRENPDGLPGEVHRWFTFTNGQPEGAPPLLAERGWRWLSLQEAGALRRKAEPSGNQREWFPIFVDSDGEAICWHDEDERLWRYHTEETDLPTLSHVLVEWLLARGWQPRNAFPKTDASLGALLERLDILIPEAAGLFYDPMWRAPAEPAGLESLRAYLGGSLPEELETLLCWHDGQGHSKELFPLFPNQRQIRALGASEIVDNHKELLARPEFAWQPEWLPIFRWNNRVWALVLTGPHAGAVATSDLNPPPDIQVYWHSLTQLVAESAHLNQEWADSPELALPADYAASPAQRRVVATGGVLLTMNDKRCDILGGGKRFVDAHVSANGVSSDWEINQRDSAREQPELLLASHEKALAEGNEPAHDLAYDVGRAAWIAGALHDCGLLTTEEAWGYARRATRVAQAVYHSWKEFGAAYVDARIGWSAQRTEAEDEDARRTESLAAVAVRKLLAPGGAWDSVDWNQPIDGAEPAIWRSQGIRVETEGELEAAVDNASPGQKIVLAAGEYRCSVQLFKTLEFVADGDVTWASPVGEIAIDAHFRSSVIVRGISFRARGLALEEGKQAIDTSKGSLYTEDCRFECQGTSIAGHRVIVSRCSFEGGRTAVMGEEFVDIEESTITRMHENAIGGDGVLRLVKSTVSHIGGHVALVDGDVTLADVEVRDTGLAPFFCRGNELVAKRVSLVDTQCGIIARDVKRVSLFEVQLEDTRDKAFELSGCQSAYVVDCSAQGLEKHALAASKCEYLRLVGCEFDQPELGAVYLDGVSQVDIHDCRLAGSKRESAIVCVGSQLELNAVEIGACPGGAAVHLENSKALLSGVRFLDGSNIAVNENAAAEVRANSCMFGDCLTSAIWVTPDSKAWIVGSKFHGGKHAAIAYGDLAVMDCEIRDTSAFFLEAAGGHVVLSRCQVEGGACLLSNSAPEGSTRETELLIVDCAFRHLNHAAIWCNSGRGVLANCRIEGGESSVRSTSDAHLDVISSQILEVAPAALIVGGDASMEIHGGEYAGTQAAVCADGGLLRALDCCLHRGEFGVGEAKDGGKVIVIGGTLPDGKGEIDSTVNFEPALEEPPADGRVIALGGGYLAVAELPSSEELGDYAYPEAFLQLYCKQYDVVPLYVVQAGKLSWLSEDEATLRRVDARWREVLADPVSWHWVSMLAEPWHEIRAGAGPVWTQLVARTAKLGLHVFLDPGPAELCGWEIEVTPSAIVWVLGSAPEDEVGWLRSKCDVLSRELGAGQLVGELKMQWAVLNHTVTLALSDHLLRVEIADAAR